MTVTKTYPELLAERAALEEKIARARSEERAAALETVKRLMSDFGIDVAELGGRRAAKRLAGQQQDLERAWQGTRMDRRQGPQRIRDLTRLDAAGRYRRAGNWLNDFPSRRRSSRSSACRITDRGVLRS